MFKVGCREAPCKTNSGKAARKRGIGEQASAPPPHPTPPHPHTHTHPPTHTPPPHSPRSAPVGRRLQLIAGRGVGVQQRQEGGSRQRVQLACARRDGRGSRQGGATCLKGRCVQAGGWQSTPWAQRQSRARRAVAVALRGLHPQIIPVYSKIKCSQAHTLTAQWR